MQGKSIDSVAVVGGGTMGYGIALEYARYGADVTLFDIDEEALAVARENVENAIETLTNEEELTESEADDIVHRIAYRDSLEEAVSDADFVTEAVSEDLSIKQEVFERLHEHAPSDAILASNTSGLSITEIASVVEDPSRVVGTHWFNPPHIVPLVEVVKGEQTDDAVAERIYELLEELGKTAVMVKKDIPGFIGNRIQMAMCYEAFSLLDRGIASAADIDKAVKAGFGFRLPILGIFEKVDQSGLDVHHEVESYLMSELDRGTEPNPVVSRLVEDGKLGLKTGQGVYEWETGQTEQIYEQRDSQLLDMLQIYREES